MSEPDEMDEDARWFCDDEGDGDYCETCGNLGTLPCECGGDLCVCLNYGEIQCPDCQ